MFSPCLVYSEDAEDAAPYTDAGSHDMWTERRTVGGEQAWTGRAGMVRRMRVDGGGRGGDGTSASHNPTQLT